MKDFEMEILPRGVYLLRVASAQHTDSPTTGRWLIQFRFETVDPPWTGHSIFASYGLEPMIAPMLTALCETLGCSIDELIRDPECRLGAEVLASIGVYTTSDARLINTIRRVTRPIVTEVKQHES